MVPCITKTLFEVLEWGGVVLGGWGGTHSTTRTKRSFFFTSMHLAGGMDTPFDLNQDTRREASRTSSWWNFRDVPELLEGFWERSGCLYVVRFQSAGPEFWCACRFQISKAATHQNSEEQNSDGSFQISMKSDGQLMAEFWWVPFCWNLPADFKIQIGWMNSNEQNSDRQEFCSSRILVDQNSARFEFCQQISSPNAEFCKTRILLLQEQNSANWAVFKGSDCSLKTEWCKCVWLWVRGGWTLSLS